MTLESPYSWRAGRLAPNIASQLKEHSSGPTVTAPTTAMSKAQTLGGKPKEEVLSPELELVDLRDSSCL